MPLFPPIADEAPPPASAVVVFPSGSLPSNTVAAEIPPVHIYVHSSDTGECPAGQSVLYASTSLPGKGGAALLETAVDTLLATVDVSPQPAILWSVQYQQQQSSGSEAFSGNNSDQVLRFDTPSFDLAFDDSVFDSVKAVWQKIVGDEGGDFLVFADREAYDDDE